MTGTPQLKIDAAKTTPSKQKCLEASVDMVRLLELWGNGEVETEDVQVMLLAFLVSFAANAAKSAQSKGGKIITPQGYSPS